MNVMHISMNAKQYLTLLSQQPIKKIVFAKTVKQVGDVQIKTIEVIHVEPH